MPKTKIFDLKKISSSDSDDSEHELSFYAKDRVKLMKEVLKIIKPKKIKSMAPTCIKHLDIVEINSMLLEELLGISSKRLQYIFKGENADRETSSSDTDDEKVDVISLDDISDDDVIELSTEQNQSVGSKITSASSNEILVNKKIKIEKQNKPSRNKKKKSNCADVEISDKNKNRLMSVLELLELQARARAIRSQLALENDTKSDPSNSYAKNADKDGSDSDAVIIHTPEFKEIVITSSESEDEITKQSDNEKNLNSISLNGPNSLNKTTEAMVVLTETLNEKTNLKDVDKENNLENSNQETFSKSIKQKIKLVRSCSTQSEQNDNMEKDKNREILTVKKEINCVSKKISLDSDCDHDEIVINLDEDEMVGIENG